MAAARQTLHRVPPRSRPPGFVASLVAAAVSALLLVLLVAQGVPASAGVTDAPVRPEEGEIQRIYRSILDRVPDRGGFGYWVSARVEGVSLRAVADGFLNSLEYTSRFGGGTDAEFVARAYLHVLGRSGDVGGVAYWRAELAAGLARTEMILLFSESPENVARTDTALSELPTYRPVTSTVTEADLDSSWTAGCPVGPDTLRRLEVDHVGLDGHHRRGSLIVAESVVDDVIEIFRALYAARYPIESIIPIDAFDGDDDASMAANNTSAFNCRRVTGGTSWSRHAYGTAIDINPIQNPYVAGSTVLPPAGSDFVDRSGYHPAMIRPGDVVTSAFAAAGWRWGGDFRTIRDYHHFQR